MQGKKIDAAERAVDRAFSTGKADRAAITRQAQLDAADAVAMAGVAMESDEEADEAARLAIIAGGMGNRDKARTAQEQAREARRKAKMDHKEATKTAKKAYDAIRFSDPTALGFMRIVQVIFLTHIAATLLALILTSRDTVVYNSVTIVDWITVILESVAFYFFVNRFKVGRYFVVGMAIFGIVAHTTLSLVNGTFSPLEAILSNWFYIFLILYFLFSDRVKSVLVNDLAHDKGVYEEEDFAIDRGTFPFYRNLIIYFVVFSVLGHWMEAGMCQFIRLGWVEGEYDPTNTMLWRDWLYPYPMEGAAVVLIALLLYPFFTWLKGKFSNRFLPYAISFVVNALTCTLIEFIGGILFNANHQNWDYSDMPFNFMGQVCLQNAVAFGVAASVIAWYVYPMLERWIARQRPALMNIACVVIAIAGGILFSLYAISPPDGIDLGAAHAARLEEEPPDDRDILATASEFASSSVGGVQEQLDNTSDITEEERAAIQKRIDDAKAALDGIPGELN